MRGSTRPAAGGTTTTPIEERMEADAFERMTLAYFGSEGRMMPDANTAAVRSVAAPREVVEFFDFLSFVDQVAAACFGEGSMEEGAERLARVLRASWPQLTERAVQRIVNAYSFQYR